MAGLAVDDVIQITYRGTIFQQSVMTVLHARCKTAQTTAPTEFDALQDIADKMGTPAESITLSNFIAAASVSLFFNDVIVQRVKPTRSIYAAKSIAEFGEVADTANTANIAVSLEKRSGNPSRKGIGRVQMPGIPTTKVSSGRVDPDYIAGLLDDFANSLHGDFSGGATFAGSFTWCLPAGGADHTYDLVDVLPKTTARTMHRRTVGLGI